MIEDSQGEKQNVKQAIAELIEAAKHVEREEPVPLTDPHEIAVSGSVAREIPQNRHAPVMLCDASPLIALVDEKQAAHTRCVALCGTRINPAVMISEPSWEGAIGWLLTSQSPLS